MGLRSHHGFYRKRRTMLLALSEPERSLLGDLLDQLVEMVAPDPDSVPTDPLAALVGINPDASTPEDPALARLLPDAYADPELAAEFRRFTESELRTGKVANAQRARETLDRPGTIELDGADVQAWLKSLNDLRLILGTRLEVTEGAIPDVTGMPEAKAQMYMVYDWLTYMQDRLVTALPDPG